ncbi:MAG: multidrug transporter [Acidobacteriota bacterium]|nr:multidrug transporter [Acidobacteriota bacterium]
MHNKPLESDWKIYRERVSEWRERYLEKKNQEIVAILEDEGKTPTERFWEARRAMDEEADILTTCLDGHSRSKMSWNLLLMHGHGLVLDEDLEEFSDGLRESILRSSRELP